MTGIFTFRGTGIFAFPVHGKPLSTVLVFPLAIYNFFSGANVNARDSKGRTAMMIATEKGHHKIIQLLKETEAKE